MRIPAAARIASAPALALCALVAAVPAAVAAPDVVFVDAPAEGATVATGARVVTFTAHSAATVRCRFGGAGAAPPFGACANATSVVVEAGAPGVRWVEVEALDAAGDRTIATRTWREVELPQARIVSGPLPSSTVRDGRVVFTTTIVGDGAQLWCDVRPASEPSGAGLRPCTTGAWSTTLADGSWVYEARGAYPGIEGPTVSRAFTVDTSPVPEDPGAGPRFCVVPKLQGLTLAAAKRRLRAANCRVGAIRWRIDGVPAARRGKVLAQRYAFGAQLAPGYRVAMWVAVRG